MLAGEKAAADATRRAAEHIILLGSRLVNIDLPAPKRAAKKYLVSGYLGTSYNLNGLLT